MHIIFKLFKVFNTICICSGAYNVYLKRQRKKKNCYIDRSRSTTINVRKSRDLGISIYQPKTMMRTIEALTLNKYVDMVAIK